MNFQDGRGSLPDLNLSYFVLGHFTSTLALNLILVVIQDGHLPSKSLVGTLSCWKQGCPELVGHRGPCHRLELRPIFGQWSVPHQNKTVFHGSIHGNRPRNEEHTTPDVCNELLFETVKGITLHLKATHVYTFKTAIGPTKNRQQPLVSWDSFSSRAILGSHDQLAAQRCSFYHQPKQRTTVANPSKLPYICIVWSQKKRPIYTMTPAESRWNDLCISHRSHGTDSHAQPSASPNVHWV